MPQTHDTRNTSRAVAQLVDRQGSEVIAMIRAVLVTHLRLLGERWPEKPPSVLASDLEVRGEDAERHLIEVARLLQAAAAAQTVKDSRPMVVRLWCHRCYRSRVVAVTSERPVSTHACCGEGMTRQRPRRSR